MNETKTVSPLRQRMIEDMAARKLKHSHIYKRFAAWLKRSPDTVVASAASATKTTKRDALRECELLVSPSIFAVRDDRRDMGDDCQNEERESHAQSAIQDEATRFPLRPPAASIRTVGADLSHGLVEFIDLVAEMIARLRIDDRDRGRDREPGGVPDRPAAPEVACMIRAPRPTRRSVSTCPAASRRPISSTTFGSSAYLP